MSISAEDMAACWCGRSPDGKCNGSHTFTDDQWADMNYEYTGDGNPQDSWHQKTDDYYDK